MSHLILIKKKEKKRLLLDEIEKNSFRCNLASSSLIKKDEVALMEGKLVKERKN